MILKDARTSRVLGLLVYMRAWVAVEGLAGGICAGCRNSTQSVLIASHMHSLAQENQSRSDSSAKSIHIFNALEAVAARLHPPTFKPAAVVGARRSQVGLKALALANRRPMIRLGKPKRTSRSIPQILVLEGGNRSQERLINAESKQASGRTQPGVPGKALLDVQRPLGLNDLEEVLNETMTWLTTFSQGRNGSDELTYGDSILKVGRQTQLLSREAEAALSESVQKELGWSARREHMAEELGRSVDDKEFATRLGLRGGAVEYRRELARMRKDKEFFILSNLGLVGWIAIKYQKQGLDFDDLIQEGILGLIKAIEKFDPSRGYKFSTMAVPWIRSFISRAIENKKSTIRVPSYMIALIRKMRREELLLLQENGHRPTREDLAERMNISTGRLESIQRAASTYAISLDAPTLTRKGTLELASRIADRKDRPDVIAEQAEAQRMLDEVIDTSLTEEESLLLRMRYGLIDGGARRIVDIAEQLNMPARKVSDMLSRAKEKLRRQSDLDQLKGRGEVA